MKIRKWQVFGEKLSNEDLTNNAKKDFNNAEKQALSDSREEFDLLINNFDFEYIWSTSLDIKSLDNNDYLVSFDSNGSSKKIKISLCKVNDHYLIDRIESYKKK